MALVLPGDVVNYRGREFIVVDVTTEDDPHAVLRAKSDINLMEPVIARVGEFQVTGHLTSVPGWKETATGEWEKQ